MKLENVKVGETYTLKVGKNLVAVTVRNVTPEGKIIVVAGTGKPMTVADAARLAPGAPVAPKTASTPKATKTAPRRNVAQRGAPQAKNSGKTSLLDAAILVLGDAKTPMNCKDVVEAILSKKLWSTSGKTPAATLYSSILREIQKKGAESRFKKTDRGQFALVG